MLEPFAQFAAGMDTEHGSVMAGHPDARSALEHTRGPDIGAEQMIAHLKQGYCKFPVPLILSRN
jgi:hypothetical protein